MTHTAENDARWEAHVASVYQTAMGWRWGCSCGKTGRGVGTPTAPGAWAAANRHVFAARRVIPPG